MNTSKAKHSIIVCCYSGESTIQKCIDSLESLQTSNIKIEVLFIDDGSLDKTATIIKNNLANRLNPNISMRYYRKENEGLSLARNYGTSKSVGDIISFIDEDAVVDKLFSTQVLLAFQKSDVNCVGGLVEIENEHNVNGLLLHESVFNWNMKNKSAIIGTNMSFRREVLVNSGGFDKIFTYRGDETALFLKLGGALKSQIDESIIVFHKQPTSIYHWLISRYENGFYGRLAISKFNISKEYSDGIIVGTWHFVSFLSFLILLMSSMVSGPISNILIIISTLSILYRYFIRQELLGPIFLLIKSDRISLSALSIIKMSVVIILGFHYYDYGYLRQYFTK
jgi:glycosyltransferase involved in cell wall biosynthesis